jgi:hypothetical protein
VSEQSANACYSCGYSLKGLAVADGLFKCPECGSLQTISYTTLPRYGALDLIRKHPLMLASPIGVAVMLGLVSWAAHETVASAMALTIALLWNILIPALYLIITVIMSFVRVPGLLQRILFFAAWLVIGVASMMGAVSVLIALGR